MTALSDLEITLACARAMGLQVRELPLCGDGQSRVIVQLVEGGVYDPLRDDGQMVALVKKLALYCCPLIFGGEHEGWHVETQLEISPQSVSNPTLNRAVCICVARAHEAPPH